MAPADQRRRRPPARRACRAVTRHGDDGERNPRRAYKRICDRRYVGFRKRPSPRFAVSAGENMAALLAGRVGRENGRRPRHGSHRREGGRARKGSRYARARDAAVCRTADNRRAGRIPRCR